MTESSASTKRLALRHMEVQSFFLNTELAAGLNFALLAKRRVAWGDDERARRYRSAARRAFDSLLRFRNGAVMSASQATDFKLGFARLEQLLLQ